MASKVKPGTPHPSKSGLVMGTKGRYVAKSTYAKQKKVATSSPPKKVRAKTTPTSTTPKSLPSAGNTSATKDTPRNFPRGRASAKRAEAAARQARAAQGTKGGTRTGQPAGSANRRFGANIVDAATGRAQRSSTARRFVRGVRSAVGGRGGALAVSQALKPVTDRIAKEAVRGAKVVTGQPNQGRPKVKSVNGVDFNVATKAGQNGYAKAVAKQRSKNNKKPASTPSTTTTTKASTPSTTKPSTRSSKPKVKKKSSVSGIGPVKSGRRYSVDVSGKSVSRQNVDQLRKMGPNSERSKKLREEAKKKSLAQGKKNRERNKRRRFGRQVRGRG